MNTVPNLLNQLKIDHAALRPYGSWLEVVAETQREERCESDRDALLLPLLATYEATRDRRIPPILMVMFWPRLRSLCRRKGAWDPDEDVRWANVLVAFHWTIYKYPVTSRADRIESKILGDTMHRLYEEYARDWRFLKRNELRDPRPKPDVAPRGDQDDAPLREPGEWDLGLKASSRSATSWTNQAMPYRQDLDRRGHQRGRVLRVGGDSGLWTAVGRVRGRAGSELPEPEAPATPGGGPEEASPKKVAATCPLFPSRRPLTK